MEFKAAFPIKIPTNRIKIAEEVFGFNKSDYHLFPYQKEFLNDPSPMKVLRFCRRGTKTTLMTLDTLIDMILTPKFVAISTMPKFTQVKEVYFQSEAGIKGHIDRMPDKYYDALIKEPLKTSTLLTNGSMVFATVPVGDTIRGHGPHKVDVDEFNFVRDDEDLWLSALAPMALTKRMKITIGSTPWNKDSVYHRMCFDKAFRKFSGNVWFGLPKDAKTPGEAKYLKRYYEIIAPNGPILPDQVEMLKEQYEGEPARWRREMECEFVDSESSFLPAELIVKCGNPNTEFVKFESYAAGSLYVGWDLGRERDNAAAAVVRKIDDWLQLIHVKRFELGTSYVSQLGYIDSIISRWNSVCGVAYDHTGTKGMDETIDTYHFPGLIEVDFGQANKHGMATTLKQMMITIRNSDRNLDEESKKRRRFEMPYDKEVYDALNVEEYEEKPGTELYTFSHPSKTHDDVFWAVALAVYAAQKGYASVGGASVSKYR